MELERPRPIERLGRPHPRTQLRRRVRRSRGSGRRRRDTPVRRAGGGWIGLALEMVVGAMLYWRRIHRGAGPRPRSCSRRSRHVRGRKASRTRPRAGRGAYRRRRAPPGSRPPRPRRRCPRGPASRSPAARGRPVRSPASPVRQEPAAFLASSTTRRSASFTASADPKCNQSSGSVTTISPTRRLAWCPRPRRRRNRRSSISGISSRAARAGSDGSLAFFVESSLMTRSLAGADDADAVAALRGDDAARGAGPSKTIHRLPARSPGRPSHAPAAALRLPSSRGP